MEDSTEINEFFFTELTISDENQSVIDWKGYTFSGGYQISDIIDELDRCFGYPQQRPQKIVSKDTRARLQREYSDYLYFRKFELEQ